MMEKFFPWGQGPRKPDDTLARPPSSSTPSTPPEIDKAFSTASWGSDRLLYVVQQMGQGVEVQPQAPSPTVSADAVWLEVKLSPQSSKRMFVFPSKQLAERAHQMLTKFYPEGCCKFSHH